MEERRGEYLAHPDGATSARELLRRFTTSITLFHALPSRLVPGKNNFSYMSACLIRCTRRATVVRILGAERVTRVVVVLW